VSGSGSKVQFQQLQMFATPAELAEMNSGDYPMHKVSNVPNIIRENREIPNRPEFYRGSPSGAAYLDKLTKSVEERGGIEEPVRVHQSEFGGPTLMDGHHRAAVAQETNRLIPVIHHDGNYAQALKEMKADYAKKNPPKPLGPPPGAI
jgi:hypothetical protein